ncbi:MAG: FkbM family methyltransferase [Pseudomonadota bacterium]
MSFAVDNAPVRPDLVFDVGAHRGEDSAFYLRLGYQVVAVEANPELVAGLRERFAGEILSGQLEVVPYAIDENEGDVLFYVNKKLSVWGTTSADWARRNQGLGADSEVVRVGSVAFATLLRQHGVPHYLKIDIEGADLQCVRALSGFAARPRYLSLESTKTSWRALLAEFDLLESLGYDRFQVVNQRHHRKRNGIYVELSGARFGYAFPPDSSGPFGECLGGEWLTRREALARYRWIFLGYFLFGDNTPGARLVRRIPFLRRALRHVSWYDTHARHRGAPVRPPDEQQISGIRTSV